MRVCVDATVITSLSVSGPDSIAGAYLNKAKKKHKCKAGTNWDTQREVGESEVQGDERNLC